MNLSAISALAQFHLSASDYIQVGLLVATAVGLTIATRAIHEQTRNSRMEKIADVLIELTGRFEALVTLRYQLTEDLQSQKSTEQDAADVYYKWLWNLISDQWMFFRLGMLPLEVAAMWFRSRLNSMRQNETVFGVSFEDGWTRIGKKQMAAYPDFVAFITTLFAMRGLSDNAALISIRRWLRFYYSKFRHGRRDYSRLTGSDG